MALIICPDCGREISSRATACPHCGCPINADTLAETFTEEVPEEEGSFTDEALAKVGDFAAGAFNKMKEVASYKRVGALEIDEPNRRFRIVKTASKDGTGMKLLKGTAALYTMGLSLAAEAAYKASKREWYSFDDLISYSVSMENERQRVSSGSRVGWGRGFSTRQHTSTTKNVTNSCSIILQMNSLDEPVIEIPILTKAANGKKIDNANAMLRETKAALELILRKQ